MAGRGGKTRRRSAGLVLADLNSGAGQILWPSVAEKAAAEDIDFFCFPGGRMGQREGYEASRNIVFDLAASANLDGALIWPSSLSGAAPESLVRGLVERFSGKPVVALSSGLPGLPAVAIDYYGGMKKAILHAIQVHGARRIAFLRGPELHEGARDRYRAYMDTLGEQGIGLDAKLVSSPWFWDCGTQAALEVLDGRGLVPGKDFDALVASSDLMALFAVKALQSRGYAIPRDLVVIGMNDSVESRVSTPPLTTAICPFARLGETGLGMLLERMAGAEVPPLTLLPSELVLRESCGCPPGSLDGDSSPTSSSMATSSTTARRRAELTAPAPSPGRSPYEVWEDERRDIALRALGRELLVSLDAGSMSAALLRGLPSLGVRSAYICTFEPGEDRSRARLVAGFRDGEDLSSPESVFPAALLVPPRCFPDRRLAYIVEALFFHDQPSGYALFEMGPKAGAFYESLRDAVSGALRNILLVADMERARLRAERADGIKTHLLSNVSHELRAPVTTILKGAQRLAAVPPGAVVDEAARAELERIARSARQQLRLVNDLLDLSRAEMDELDISRAPMDPGPLLSEVFSDYAADPVPTLSWILDMPERLPLILADGTRIRQIVGNLLDNARKFTSAGSIRLGVRVETRALAISVSDTGPGIVAKKLPRIFEPFVSAGRAATVDGGPARMAGAGLGLGIARHLALLHYGSLEARSEEGRGSTFTLRLPLPDPGGRKSLSEDTRREDNPECGGDMIALICAKARDAEDAESEAQGYAAARLGLPAGKVRCMSLEEAESGALERMDPAAIAWDMADRPGAAERNLFRKIRQNAGLLSKPLLVYPASSSKAAVEGELPSGVGRGSPAGFAGKDLDPESFARFAGLILEEGDEDAVLVADDDPGARADACRMIAAALPGRKILVARDGAEAWEIMRQTAIGLAVLDIVMPPPDGFRLLEKMRADPRLAGVPVLLLTDKVVTMEDISRIEFHPRLALRNKGILSPGEAEEDIRRLAEGREWLPAPTGAVAKRSIAYLNRNYTRALTRWKLAEAVGVSEDYLTRVFRAETGMTPWDYLARLRIAKAGELLLSGAESVGSIAARVGIADQAYFSRVFRKVTGMTPQAFRSSGPKGSPGLGSGSPEGAPR